MGRQDAKPDGPSEASDYVNLGTLIGIGAAFGLLA
jgi:hypothetical protein